MPSNAFTGHLVPLLRDAEDLIDVHRDLRRAGLSSPSRLAALNRAMVVLCVSAWEAYVEELVRDFLAVIRPAGVPDPTWAVLVGPALRAVQRFNTPDPGQVRQLLRETTGLEDVFAAWTWRNSDATQGRIRLQRAIELRHQIAHGVNPRPSVLGRYSFELPDFFRRLGRSTDEAVRDHLVTVFNATNPWPP